MTIKEKEEVVESNRKKVITIKIISFKKCTKKANMNGRVKWLAGIPIAIKDHCGSIDFGIC